jgi:hypothetical protein
MRGKEIIERGVWHFAVHRAENISKTNALLWGVAWLIISTIAGWRLLLAPAGVVGYDVVGYMPLAHHLLLNAVVWMCLASVVYLFMLLLNSKAKFVDSYARLLFAHWPVTLMLLPALVVGKVKYAMFVNDFMALLHADALTAVLMALLSVVIVVWTLYWSYAAFRRGVSRGGWATWCSFILGYYLASRLCEWVLGAVCQGFVVG